MCVLHEMAGVWRNTLCDAKSCVNRALVFGLKLWSNQLLFATMDVASHIISFDSGHSRNLPFLYDNIHTPTLTHASNTRRTYINFNQWRRRRGGTWHMHCTHARTRCIYRQRQIEWNTRYIQLLFDVWICYF